MKRIAIFASGAGTNAENAITFFNAGKEINVHLVLTDNAEAGVRNRAQIHNVPHFFFPKADFREGSQVLKKLQEEKIDMIVLAGFLLLVPPKIIENFKGRIINIHPALLPAFGGKGFYGPNVHKAVIDSGSLISGITIHHVNEHFDKGEIIFQAACHVAENETPETLASKIHQLEYSYFPVVIEKVINRL